MHQTTFEILPTELLEAYQNNVAEIYLKAFEQLEESELSIDSFRFYTSVSAVYSSKIEGESIELDSYVKHKRFGVEFLPDYTQRTDDLYNAYQFAKTATCNKNNIALAHQILTKHILPKSKQGRIRTDNMCVTTPNGKIEYVAASSFALKVELEKFSNDLELLIKIQLSLQKYFTLLRYCIWFSLKFTPLMMEMAGSQGLLKNGFWLRSWEKQPG